MFFVFKINVIGLEFKVMYFFLFDFVFVEGYCWKYVNGEWVLGGKFEFLILSCVYIYFDLLNFGVYWMK